LAEVLILVLVPARRIDGAEKQQVQTGAADLSPFSSHELHSAPPP